MHENREVFGRYGIFDSDWHRTEGSGSAGNFISVRRQNPKDFVHAEKLKLFVHIVVILWHG
ncbi:hypothetical protein D4Q76_00805 [archaeon]|nr:MAG: hypothetical protein D4Q76_00805 [archaeon]